MGLDSKVKRPVVYCYAKNIRNWSFMELIVTDIVNIIKSESNFIKRERKLIIYFLHLISQLMALAIEKVDQELVTEAKNQGYQVEKKSTRVINMAFGEVRYTRRRYVCPGKKARYPLDELMGFNKYKRYSVLAVRNILEVSSTATYRNTALAINCLAGFSISHAQVGSLIKQAGKQIKNQQEAESRYDGIITKRKVPVLYLEGDGVMIKGTKGRLEFHRYQVCEGVNNITFKRKQRTEAKDFVSLSRLDALHEMREYLANNYDLSETLIISNADGGAGYTKGDFDELIGKCARHEHFLDVFHLNKKVKDRLNFAPELQGRLIMALEYSYDRKAVNLILDTAESMLINELDTGINHENLRRLRSYIERRWADIKPFKQRKLQVIKAIGSCESNHRKYTYRVKGQGKYWSKQGAEGMLRILTCLKNDELEYWLNSNFKDAGIKQASKDELKVSVRASLKKKHEEHVGIKQGIISEHVNGGRYISKLNQILNKVNM